MGANQSSSSLSGNSLSADNLHRGKTVGVVEEQGQHVTMPSTEDNSTESLESKSSSTKSKKQVSSSHNLEGFALVEHRCRRKKRAYNKCHATKYRSWMSGEASKAGEDEEENTCDDLFEAYKRCIIKGMLKERKKEGLPPPNPDSILGEYDE